MSDLVKLLVAAVAITVVVVLVLMVLPKEPPNRVIIPIEQVNAAVIPFEDRALGGVLGEELRSAVENELVKRPGIQIFSRDRLDQILKEQILCAQGLCAPETALEIGRLTGVNKLVTGVLLSANSSVADSEICKEIELWPPGCKRSVPGREFKVEIEAQVQILNAQSGQIEVSERLKDAASVKVEANRNPPDTMQLVRTAIAELSERIADKIQSGYTREVRYGIYKDYKEKGGAYEGVNAANLFTSQDKQVVVIVHLVRMQPEDQFMVAWTDPLGTRLESPLIGAKTSWIPFALPLEGKPTGTWTVEGFVNGQKVFTDSFTVLGPS